MTKVIDGYISELEGNLSNMPKNDRQDVIEFYHEFLLDGDFVRRSTIEQELGTPKQLAIKILADYSVADVSPTKSAEQKASRSNVKAIWYILLGICSIPMGIPLVIAAFAIIFVTFVLFVIVIGIVLALVIGGGRILLGSVALLFTQNWAVGCFYIGIVLIGIAICLFLSPLIAQLINFLIAECAKFMRRLGKKGFKNNYYQPTTNKHKEK